MVYKEFVEMLSRMDVDEVAEVVRLQNEMIQATDFIEFLIQDTHMDVFTLKREMETFKIAHNNFKRYIDLMHKKYCTN